MNMNNRSIDLICSVTLNTIYRLTRKNHENKRISCYICNF